MTLFPVMQPVMVLTSLHGRELCVCSSKQQQHLKSHCESAKGKKPASGWHERYLNKMTRKPHAFNTVAQQNCAHEAIIMWSDATCMLRMCIPQDSKPVCTCRMPVAAQHSHTWGSDKPHWKGHAVPLSSSTASRPAHLAQRSSSQNLRQTPLLQVLLQLADAQQLQLQVLIAKLLRQGRLQMMTCWAANLL